MDEIEVQMANHQSKAPPTWADVKVKLRDFDRRALLELIHNLYAAHKNNQLFLHVGFGLSDALKPYKQIIDRWLWPDVLRKEIAVRSSTSRMRNLGKYSASPCS